ncbi:carbohydrate ABC transporter permease, partial [Dactylosporangium sp. NPDC000521]
MRRTTVALVGIFAFGPVYWVLVTALTPTQEVFRFPPRLFPEHLTVEHFTAILDNAKLLRYLTNSLIVSTVTAVLTV